MSRDLKPRIRRHFNLVIFRLQKQTEGKNELREVIVEELLDRNGTDDLHIVDDEGLQK